MHESTRVIVEAVDETFIVGDRYVILLFVGLWVGGGGLVEVVGRVIGVAQRWKHWLSPIGWCLEG